MIQKEWTDEEVKEFIKTTMKSVRGQSAYFNDYCSHLDQSMPPLEQLNVIDFISPVFRVLYSEREERRWRFADI